MKPYYQWTEEEKNQLAEKLKRTLDDELVDDLMKNMYLSVDQLQQIANTHESWEIWWERWRDEMAAARYQDEVKIITALRGQVEKLTDMLVHLNNAFNWCVHHMLYPEKNMLYPEKNEEQSEPPASEEGGE